jgi:hypothetical protein
MDGSILPTTFGALTVLCIAGWFFKMAGQAAVRSLPGQVRIRENPTNAQGNP